MSSLDDEIKAARNQICDWTLITFAVISVPALAASLYRAFSFGWLHVMTLHVVLAIVIWGVTLFRRSISYNLRVLCVAAFFYLIGVAGLIQFGLIAGGTSFLIIVPALVTILLDVRAGIATMVIIILTIIGIGYYSIMGLSRPGFDIEVYATQSSTWIGFISVLIIAMGSMLAAISVSNKSMLNAMERANKKEEAEEANRAKSKFLSSMSHELRTPMTSILGFAQLLKINTLPPLSEAQHNHVNHILEGGAHLLGLINQVLEFSKIDSTKVALSIENVMPEKSIKECLNMVRLQAEERNIELVYALPDFELPILRTDRSRLYQVLLNLLSNAIKYNQDGGRVTVSVSSNPENGFLRISIVDNGYGIAREKQKDLFEPFNRLGREAGKIKGTGIGLVIAREVIKLLDGKIGFESEENVGSTFWVELPVSKKSTTNDDAIGKRGG